MPAIKLFRFDGMRPGWDSRLIEDNMADYSRDAFLYDGTLIGWRKPKLLHKLANASARAAYRIPVDPYNTTITAPSYWVEFNDANTDVVRNATISDTFQRYYFASPAGPPTYNTLARIAAGNSGANQPFLLGVPAPGCPPIVTASGGGGSDGSIQEARAYVITWVTAYGEESAPSAYSLVNAFTDSTWEIDLTSPSQSDMGQTQAPTRNIVAANIYRTVTSQGGTATYFFVAQVPINTLTYIDGQGDDVVALNNQLQTIGWGPPPSDLQGMVSMPNGMIAGFRKNEVWFCQPFYPHAWPSSYILTTEYPIVGCGVTGQSLVVCTEGYPVIVAGINPGAMAETHSTVLQPCVSKGSIVSADAGVFYTSPNGLIVCQAGGFTTNFTEGWITRDKWQKLVPPLGIRAVNFLASYFAFGTVAASSAISATGTITSTANYDNGDTITVGGVTYTFTSPFVNAANNVAVGSTEVLSMQNLVDSVNLNNPTLAGIEFGTGTVVNHNVTAGTDSQHVLTFTAVASGPSGNAIALSQTSDSATASGATLVGGTDSVDNTTYAQQGFTVDFGSANFAQRWLGFGLLSAPNAVDVNNLWLDRWTGVLLMIQGGQVLQYDFTDQSPALMSYKWRSKIYQQMWKHNFEAAKIYFDIPPNTPTQNQVRVVDPTQPALQAGQYGIVRVYGGSDALSLQLVTTREIRSSSELLRILSGYKVDYWQIELEGTVKISGCHVATSVKELREI